MFGELFIFEFLTPSTLGNYNFLNYIPFFTIFSAPDVPIGGFKFCLDTRNNRALSLDLTYLENLSVQSFAGLP